MGRWVKRRPIVAWVQGPSTASRKVLLIGVIHGNEQAGLAITNVERQRGVPRGVQLWIVPELNPDGVATERLDRTLHGVDLNRIFPCRLAVLQQPDVLLRGHGRHCQPETPGLLSAWSSGSTQLWQCTYHQHINLVSSVWW